MKVPVTSENRARVFFARQSYRAYTMARVSSPPMNSLPPSLLLLVPALIAFLGPPGKSKIFAKNTIDRFENDRKTPFGRETRVPRPRPVWFSEWDGGRGEDNACCVYRTVSKTIFND